MNLKKTNLVRFEQIALLDSSVPRSSALAGARQSFFDDIADRFELVDPCGVQPEEIGSRNATCGFANFFFGNIFTQGIVKSTGLLIGVEPCSLAFARYKPMNGDNG